MAPCLPPCPSNCAASAVLKNILRVLAQNQENTKIALVVRTDGSRKIIIGKRKSSTPGSAPVPKRLCDSSSSNYSVSSGRPSSKGSNVSSPKKLIEKAPIYAVRNPASNSSLKENNHSTPGTFSSSDANCKLDRSNTYKDVELAAHDTESESDIEVLFETALPKSPTSDAVKKPSLPPPKVSENVVAITAMNPDYDSVAQTNGSNADSIIDHFPLGGNVDPKPVPAGDSDSSAVNNVANQTFPSSTEAQQPAASLSVDELVDRMPLLSTVTNRQIARVAPMFENNDVTPWHMLEKIDCGTFDLTVSIKDSGRNFQNRVVANYFAEARDNIKSVESAFSVFYRNHGIYGGLIFSKKPRTTKISSILIHVTNEKFRVLIKHFGKPTSKTIKMAMWQGDNSMYRESFPHTLPGIEPEEGFEQANQTEHALVSILLFIVKNGEYEVKLPPVMITKKMTKVFRISLEQPKNSSNDLPGSSGVTNRSPCPIPLNITETMPDGEVDGAEEDEVLLIE